jgi:diguanylate cyclase (GGDEF)-like protein
MERAQAAFEELKLKGYVRYEDLPLKTKDGATKEVEFVSNRYESDGEQVIQCNIRDITDRKIVEIALNQTNESLKLTIKKLAERNREIELLSEMGDSLQSCVSIEESYRVVARFSVQLFPGTQGALFTMKVPQNLIEAAIEWGGTLQGEQEFAPNDCVGLRRGRVHAINEEDSSSKLICQHLDQPVSNYLCAPMIAYGEIQGVLHLRGVENGPTSTEPRANPLEKTKQDLAGTVADYTGLAMANLKLREALRQESIHDAVTGLYNRRYMKEALERELRRSTRSQHPLGILMFDIDHFKKLNDSFGHEAGDAALGALGNFLKMQVRGNDIPCRYGGEEFLVILPRIPLDECGKRAEKLREAIKRLEVQHSGKPLPTITFSVGVAAYPDHGSNIDELLRVADTALYKAKAQGRDRVVIGRAVSESPLQKSSATSLN